MALAQWIMDYDSIVVVDELDEVNSDITYYSHSPADYITSHSCYITILKDEEIENTEKVYVGSGMVLNLDVTKDKVISGMELLFASDMQNRKFPQIFFHSSAYATSDGIGDWDQSQYYPDVEVQFPHGVSVGLFFSYNRQLYSVKIVTEIQEDVHVIL